MKINEFINNDNLKEAFDELDKKIFLETAHLSDFYEVLNNKYYKIIVENIDDFLPFIIEKIINNEYKFAHKLLVENVAKVDKNNFIDSISNWWDNNKHNYGK